MPSSAEKLREGARQLLREAEGFIDPKLKQELASRAFELAQRAERIDVLVADPERLKAETARFCSMLMEASLGPAPAADCRRRACRRGSVTGSPTAALI